MIKKNLSTKYDNIFKLLENFNFDITVTRELLCVLCHTLIKDSYQNICGCRYCYKCISRFTEMDEKYCPGHTDLCKLIFEKGKINSDQATNRKLSLLIVKCPIDNCKYKTQLKDMEEHMQSHNKKCPFVRIGCQSSDKGISNISEHMNHERGNHFTLLMDKIEKLQFQVDSIESNVSLPNPFQVENLENLYTNQNSEIKNLKTEINEVKNAIISLEKSNKYQDKTEGIIQELKELRFEIENQKATSETMSKEFKWIANDLKKLNYNSDLWNEIKRHDKLISSIKSDVNQKEKSDKNHSDKLIADILSVKKDAARSLSQYDLCRSDYRYLEKKLKNAESKIEEKNVEQKSDIDELDKQFKTLQNQLMILQENFQEEKVLADDLEVRWSQTRLDMRNYDERQKQLMGNYERLEDEARAITEDLTNSKLKLEAQVSELYRHTGILMSGKVIRGLPKQLEWEVDDFPYKFQRAMDGRDPFITSEWFVYLDYRLGFKMYPCGTEGYTGTHLSVLLFIIKTSARDIGSVDKWITISVVDQMDGSTTISRRFLYSSLVKEERTESIEERDQNTPLGAIDFVPLETLRISDRYIKDQRLLIRANIESRDNHSFDEDGL